MKTRRIARIAVRLALAAAASSLVISCASAPTESDKAAATKGMVKRSELEIVDCLLPGQVRQLGNTSYLTQRRPVRTTTADCSLRGGEYVAYDRADLQSALRIWLQAAEAGDADAQLKVGEIYERGLGVPPDYATAASWYEKAANQGNSAAAFNLATLYRQGQGVEEDRLKALNLLAKASNLSADSVIFTSAANAEQEALRKELETVIAEKDAQLGVLEKQVKELESKLAKQAKAQTADTGSPQLNQEINALKRLIANIQEERRKSTERIAGIPKIRTPQGTVELTQLPPTADERTVSGMKFGRYYAVVIGNQNYENPKLENLDTPKRDAERVFDILADKYGFTVTLLDDANDIDILKTINDLNAVVKPEDNVLIYYAGHGARLTSQRAENGYWLPVNADPPPKDTYWVPNEQITGHLGRLSAKRVLVVADSCYAGLLSNDPSYLFMNDNVKYSKEYIAFKLPKRARLLLSSGGDKPVLDEGSGGNSVFARAFIDELESNTGILSSPELFSRIAKRVEVAAARNRFVQKPEFKSIKGAGHEVGDFFFVPRAKS